MAVVWTALTPRWHSPLGEKFSHPVQLRLRPDVTPWIESSEPLATYPRPGSTLLSSPLRIA
jgi:hypothetical protein